MIKYHVPHECKKQLYYAYVYSKIIYGIEVCGNIKSYQLNQLQVLQNRISKILYNKDWWTNTEDLHKEIAVLKIKDITKLCKLKFVHKWKNNEIPDIL